MTWDGRWTQPCRTCGEDVEQPATGRPARYCRPPPGASTSACKRRWTRARLQLRDRHRAAAELLDQVLAGLLDVAPPELLADLRRDRNRLASLAERAQPRSPLVLPPICGLGREGTTRRLCSRCGAVTAHDVGRRGREPVQVCRSCERVRSVGTQVRTLSDSAEGAPAKSG